MLLDRQFPHHSPPLSWLLSECENEKGRRRRRKKLCCNSIRYNLISLGCLQYIGTWNPCCCWGGGALESHRARRGSIRLSRFIFWHDIQVLCVHLNIFIGVLLGQKKKNTTNSTNTTKKQTKKKTQQKQKIMHKGSYFTQNLIISYPPPPLNATHVFWRLQSSHK